MKKNLFGIGFIAGLALVFFSGCSLGDDHSKPEPETEKAKIIFDEEKISCTNFREEIHNGDLIWLGACDMTFTAKEFESGKKVIWKINGEEKEVSSYSTLDIHDLGEDNCIKVDGKYQLTVDVTVREAVNPKVVFDSDKFTCRSYDGVSYLEILSSPVESGSIVKEGKKLIFISKDPDKIIASYTINDGDSQTEGIDFEKLADISVCPENSSNNILKIEITTRDIIMGVLTISDDDVVCLKKVGFNTEAIKDGAEVKERDVISFYHKERGFITDGYTLNGTAGNKKLSSDGYVNEFTVTGDTVKDGKLEFSFNTHAALKVTVKINEDIPFFCIRRYASNEDVKSTAEGINRDSVVLYEEEVIEFHNDASFIDDPMYGFSVGEQESKTFGGTLKNNGGTLVLDMGREEFTLTDGCEFKKLAE